MKIVLKLLNLVCVHIVFLFVCVSQGRYGVVVKARNDRATQNRVLEDSLSKAHKYKYEVIQDL